MAEKSKAPMYFFKKALGGASLEGGRRRVTGVALMLTLHLYLYRDDRTIFKIVIHFADYL